MAVLRSIVLPITALIVVCLWIGLAVWYGFDRYLDDDRLIDLLEKHRFYSGAADFLRDIVVDSVDSGLSPGDVAAVDETLAAVLSEEWVREEVDRNLRGILAALAGDGPAPGLTVDFLEPKSELKRLIRERYSRSLADKIALRLTDIPDVIDLAGHWGVGEIAWMAEVGRYRSYYVAVIVAWGLLTLVSFLLAGVAGGLRWAGTTAIIAGIPMILAATVGLHFGLRAMDREFTSFATELAGIGYGMGRDVLRVFGASIRNFAIVLTCGGAALLGGSFALGRGSAS